MIVRIDESKLLALVLDLFDLLLHPSDVLCDYGLTECDLKLLHRAMSDFFDREIDWSNTTVHNSIRQLTTHASIKLGENLELEWVCQRV